MNRAVVIGAGVFALLAAACSPIAGPSPRASTPLASPIASSSANDVSFYFSIDEVGLGPQGYITLRNYTDVAASLDHVFLCQSTGCVDLPDVIVQPGESVRVAVGDGTGLENVVMTGAHLDLPPADGEVAIYASDDVRNPAKMRYYVQWGSTPHPTTRGLPSLPLLMITGTHPDPPSVDRAIRALSLEFLVRRAEKPGLVAALRSAEGRQVALS